MGSGDVCTSQTAAATVNPVIITSREQFLATHANRK
jgi:hypothetical protein